MESVTASNPLVKGIESSEPQAFSTYFNVVHRATSAYPNPGLPSFLHIRSQPSQSTVSGDAPSLTDDIQPTLPQPTPACRLYYAGTNKDGIPSREASLLYADICPSLLPPNDAELNSKPLLFQAPELNPRETSLAASLLRERMRMEYSGISDLKVDVDTGCVLVLMGGQLLHFFDNQWGINSLSPTQSANNDESPLNGVTRPTLIPVPSPLQPAICPMNPYLVAMVSDIDLILASVPPPQPATGVDASATPPTIINLTNLPANAALSAGSPAYVIQEEFDRYVGFWWRPHSETTSTGSNVYWLLYEETDESMVDISYLPRSASWGAELEPHRYPKAGKANATSTLKLVRFEMSQINEIVEVRTLNLPWPLFKLLPDFEYIVRVGWTKDGSYAWVQLANRVQSRFLLLLIPPEDFVNQTSLVDSADITWHPLIQLLEEVDAQFWIESNDCLTFLTPSAPPHATPVGAATEGCEFIAVSRRSGFSHLYHYRCEWPSAVGLNSSSRPLSAEPPSDPIIEAKIKRVDQLTFGEWEVLPNHIFLDEANNLILFEGLREHPLWPNVYAVGYGKALGSTAFRLSTDLPAQQLASEGLSPDCGILAHSIIAFDAKSGLLVLASSNHTHMPGFAVYQLHTQPSPTAMKDGQAQGTYLPNISQIAWLKNHRLLSHVLPRFLQPLAPPRVLTCRFMTLDETMTATKLVTATSSLTLYGLLFTPNTRPPPPTGFPTVHLVYGGPGVQLVRGSCIRSLFIRAQILCHYGYAVLLCDCRGSANRGAAFAGHIKLKLGVPELDDHIQFLKEAARKTGLIDLQRVAIHGSSYGGYMSLMAAARYGDTYRAAIAGSPVVDWAHYDTAYTERYLGLPSEHPEAYTIGSVLSYLQGFPDDAPYLMISHGGQDENVHFSHTSSLLQRLDSLGKPYEFFYYPASRHGIREDDHLTACILSFLDRTIRSPPVPREPSVSVSAPMTASEVSTSN
uniref:Dipeptidyl peptidase 9 n=1 Tax=Schistocephalus solidus TaxID=70667 RepID=A0A0X3P3G4_SCHSO